MAYHAGDQRYAPTYWHAGAIGASSAGPNDELNVVAGFTKLGGDNN